MSAMAVDLIVGFVELEGVFELALPVAVGGEGVTLGASCAARRA